MTDQPQSQSLNNKHSSDSGSASNVRTTSYWPVSFPAFDETKKIEHWVTMVRAAFKLSDEHVTWKKCELLNKLPNKYFNYLMEHFDGSLEDMLDAITKKINSEPVSLKLLHTKFDPFVHVPADFVEEMIRICERKKYTDTEIVQTIVDSLPAHFSWFTSLSQKDHLIFAMEIFCDEKKAQIKPKFDTKPKGYWCYTCAALKKPAKHNFRTCVHAQQFKRKSQFVCQGDPKKLKKDETNEETPKDEVIKETPKDADSA